MEKYIVLLKICLLQMCLGFSTAWPVLGTQEIVFPTNMILATAILIISFSIVVRITITPRTLWMAWGLHAASAIGTVFAFSLEYDLAMIPFCVLYGASIGILYKWCIELVLVLFSHNKTITLGIISMCFGLGGIILLLILSQQFAFTLVFAGTNILYSVICGIVIYQEGKRELLPIVAYQKINFLPDVIQKMVVCMAFTSLSCLLSILIMYDQLMSNSQVFEIALMICIASVIGRILWPLIAVRSSQTFVFITMFYLQIIALGIVLAWTDRAMIVAVAAVLLIGSIYGGTVSLIPTLVTIYFEPEYWNDLISGILKTWALTAAAGLLLTTFSYVVFGTYCYILYVNFMLLVIGLISSLKFNWY